MPLYETMELIGSSKKFSYFHSREEAADYLGNKIAEAFLDKILSKGSKQARAKELKEGVDDFIIKLAETDSQIFEYERPNSNGKD